MTTTAVARRFVLVLCLSLAALAAAPVRSLAVSAADLPPVLQELPLEDLIKAFSVSWETPSIAAETARLRAWSIPARKKGDAEEIRERLVKVMQDYPGTSDARRALLDISISYAQKGDWATAEAPYRYIMEVMKGRPEERIARTRLLILYQYAETLPERVDAIAECRAAVAALAGTPEEGLARMTLAELLSKNHASEEAFAEYARAISQFPNQPYTNYVRIHYALGLAGAEHAEEALKVIEPVLADPLWVGRAYQARGKAHYKLKMIEEALADFRKASQTADSVSVRGDALAEMAAIYENLNQPDRARECLRACIDVQPWRSDRTDLEVKLARNILASGDYARAAGMALALEAVVLNDPQHYAAPGQLDRVVKGCDDILDACERAGRGEDPSPAQ